MAVDIQVGINSYVEVADADDYIGSHYISTNDARASWEALSDDDKAAALIASCMALNNLKYKGRRAAAGQILEFPRTNARIGGVAWLPVFNPFVDTGLGGHSAVSSDGLNKAVMAQIENALWSVFFDADITDQADIKLRGITSKRTPSISESYGKPDIQTTEGISTKKVYSILSEWLSSSRYVL